MSIWNNYNETRPYLSNEMEKHKIKQLTDFFSEYNINVAKFSALEVGAGHGIYTGILFNIFDKLIAIEPNTELYNKLTNRYAEKGVSTYNVSIEKFKTNKKFDTIIFMNVFLFVKNKQKVLVELATMIKSNKFLIIMEPFKFLKFDGQKHNIQKLMTDTVIFITKSKKFELVYYGFILNGQICFILKKI